MESFSESLKSCKTPAMFFLGQAGFVFKTAKGTTLAVDLYLSDCCEREFGFKRLMPYLLTAEEVEFDYIVATHAHYDHFDIDAMPCLMANDRTKLLAARDCKPLCEKLNIPAKRITYLAEGDVQVLLDIKLEAVFCDHGDLSPEALGLILRFDDISVYIAGDTAFAPSFAETLAGQNLDIMIMPINGAFGNLNEKEAAELCAIVRPKLAVPCHFWNFAEHHGDPKRFTDALATRSPSQKYLLMRMGEMFVLSKE